MCGLTRAVAVACALCVTVRRPPARAAEGVPPPEETPARVTVSGRTSTAADVKIAAVGQKIPATFSGERVKNTPSFSWWVSEHYAFKTDYKEEKARFYLTLLELAYPYYVELFGREPEGMEEKRMAVTYGSSRKEMERAMASDLGYNWTFAGGGITLEGLFCAYQYPSGSLKYHQRYILIHECAHLFQMCLLGTTYSTPGWHIEGIADGISSHVYDEKRKRLTVFVLDKAAIPNFLDEGRRAFADPAATFRKLHDEGNLGRGANFVAVQYFLTDPGRSQLFKLWRDEIFRLAPRGERIGEVSARLLVELFGPWDALNVDFKSWLDARRNTFHYVDWGWEQDSNTLWSYGWPQRGPLSRTDVNMPPAERPEYDPLRMDHPAEEMPAIVGPVERGVAEPSVGCVIDFSRNPAGGKAGIGLGVVGSDVALAFPDGMVFADRDATREGLTTTAYRLGKVQGKGVRPEDVGKGAKVASSVDRQVALGREGSATKGLTQDFVVEWEGGLRIVEEGEYTFATASDDGSWLWVDDALVVANGGYHGVETVIGRRKLARGMHRIRVRFFQGRGGRHCAAGIIEGEMPGFLRVLVEKAAELVIDGTDLGLETKAVAIPGDFRSAMKANGHRVGMNVKVAREALEVTLRAGKGDAMKAFAASLPVPDVEARERLLTMPLTILARDGYHGVTQFFDDRRRMEPDLTIPAPSNRWRNPGDHALYLVHRACWRLGERAPRSLLSLRREMLEAADGGPAEQRRALMSYSREARRIVRDIRRSARDPDRPDLADLAAAELLGASVRLRLEEGAGPDEVEIRAEVTGPELDGAEGVVRFALDPAGAADRTPAPERVLLGPHKETVKRTCRLRERSAPLRVRAEAELTWRGETIRVIDSRSLLTSVPRWWLAGPFENPGGHSADVAHPPEKDLAAGRGFDAARTYAGKGAARVRWRKVERDAALGATREHFLDLNELFGRTTNAAAYAFAYLDSDRAKDAVLAVGSDDGVIAWLNGEKVHANLRGRGYSPRADLARMRLREGRNELLLKITQGGGDWSFGAHIEDGSGGALEGVTVSLEGGRR